MSDQNARERIAGLLWWSVPSGTTEEAKALTEQMLDAYRSEITAEFTAWLVKRAREHRAQGPQYTKQADVIGMLADKVSRGAVRPNNLLLLPPQGGPEDVTELRAIVGRVETLAADWERRGQYGDAHLTEGARAIRTALGQTTTEALRG